MRETSIILVTDERNVSLLKSLKLMVLNCIRFLFVESFLLFCVEFKKPEIFCCWCVLELVVLYEGMINMVILPYLSRLLVLIQNVDELSSRLAG